jgi:hypothetical protein
VRDRGVATDLAAIAGVRAARDEALRAIDLADGVEHRVGRLVARALRGLRLRDTGPRVALEQPVCEVAPADALADERDLRGGLDRHLRLDLLDDANDLPARELRQRRASVAEDPRIAVLIGADGSREIELGERPLEGCLRPRLAGVFEVVLDSVERGLRLRMLELEPRDDERPRAVGAEDERDRPLRRYEREAGVVEDVVRVEEDDARESRCLGIAEQRVAPRAVLLRCDRDRREHRIGSSLVPHEGDAHPTAGGATFKT